MKASDMVPQTRDYLTALGSRRGPIIVGPWLSEVGFELLYWIPFLRWACTFAGLHAEDLWIVSRGGCRSWYADLSAQYVDVMDVYSPEAFRAGNRRRVKDQSAQARGLGLRDGLMSTKQHAITSFDQDIIGHVTRARLDVFEPRLLHPSLMYGLFRSFWKRQSPSLYDQMTTPQRLTAPARIEGLPASYVAVKFYASQACQQTALHLRMVNDIVRRLAASTDVVLLHDATRYDEHGDFPIEKHPRVHRVPVTPATNLETHTAVMAHATLFVGTYGGFAYLAPFLGIPARTFYTTPNFRRDHRQVLQRVCEMVLQTPFSVDLLGGGSGSVARRVARRRMVRRAA